jgi:hypothetical protein
MSEVLQVASLSRDFHMEKSNLRSYRASGMARAFPRRPQISAWQRQPTLREFEKSPFRTTTSTTNQPTTHRTPTQHRQNGFRRPPHLRTSDRDTDPMLQRDATARRKFCTNSYVIAPPHALQHQEQQGPRYQDPRWRAPIPSPQEARHCTKVR